MLLSLFTVYHPRDNKTTKYCKNSEPCIYITQNPILFINEEGVTHELNFISI